MSSSPSSAKFNTLSIVAFILAFFVAILGVILGHVSLNQIKKTGERGRALAIWALVLGYLGILGYIIIIITAVAAAGSGAAMG